MDGSTSSFLYDNPFLSGPGEDYSGGILYVEDFDELRARERTAERPADTKQPQAPAPLTRADVDLARSEGHAEGMRTALADAAESRAQLELAALQSLADSLAAARVSLERVATHHAADCARVMITMVAAALPATMVRYGAIEIEAMVNTLLPGLVCEPELRVRAHPDFADAIRDRLAEHLSSGGVVLSVVADPKTDPGDVEIAWQQGHARRDCKAVWSAIETALGPLNLPSIEEVCHSHGS